MLRPPETFVTHRLVLRQPAETDANAMFEEYAQDLEVTRFLRWHPHRQVEEAKKFVEICLADWKQGRFAWVVTEEAKDRAIGLVSCYIVEHRAELAFVLGRRYWGLGYMTEAAQAVMDWTLSLTGIHRVWAVCDTENKASWRVLEKLGMHREGVLRRWALFPNISNEPRDCFVYSRVRGDAAEPTGSYW